MAEQVAAVTLQVDGSQAVSSMAEMRQQIQQANDKLIQMVTTYGEASAEAAAAAGEVAALRDQLDAANQLTAAMNPDAPFAALGGAVQGVIGGFTAAQGAMATFGLESKAAEDVIAGLEGAMALQSGVEGIMASVESFRTLGAVLKQNTVIQRIMNFVTQGQFVTTAALTGATTAQATAETANAVATEASAVATTEQAVASGTAAAATTAQTAATVGSTTAMSAARIAAIALRGALMLIGIGALIIGIVALIKVIQDWTDESKEQEKQIAKSRKEYDDLNKSLEDNGTQFDKNQKHQLAMAKASGASAEAIRKLELKLADEKIAYEQSALAIAKQTAEKARNYLQTLKNADADEEQLNKQQAVVDDFTKLEKEKTQAVANAVEARKDIERQHEVDIKQAETDRKNKSREDAKKAAQDRKQQAEKDRADRKKEAEERQKEIDNETKASAERTKKLEEENYLASIQDEQKRADAKLQIDYENAIKALNQSKATEEQKAKELEAINAKFLLDKAALEEKARKDKETKDKEAADKEKAARDKALKVEQDTFDIAFQARMAREENEFVRRQEEEALRYQKELDNLYVLLNNKEITQQDFDTRYAAYKSNNELNIQKIAEDSAKAQKEIDEKSFQAKMDAYGKIGAMLGSFSELVGKQTAAGKTFAVAQASIDTYTAAWTAFKNAQANPISILGPAYPYIQAGLAVAGGIANIKKILAVPVPGKGGGGGTAPSGGVNASVNAPIPVQASTTMLDQNQVNQMASATARAFVVESDVSGNQERIRRLNRAARIN